MVRLVRRDFLIAAGALLTLPLAAEAQQPARLPRIGVLLAGNTTFSFDDMREGFRELGYIEGRTAASSNGEPGKASPSGSPKQSRN